MMRIVGLCRFSLVGRGDWRATRQMTAEEFGAIASERAAMLFAPRRLEARLATFEHLTLASLKAQTDPDFTFVVLASSLMPEFYQDRLEAACAEVPQVVLRYFPVTSAEAAQDATFRELGIRYGDTLQFRLDDDDCLCADYVEVMRQNAAPLMGGPEVFAASLTGVMFSVLNGPGPVVYDWPVAFYSAGAAMRHPRRSIFRFGHYALPQRFPHVTLPRGMALVTHDGSNDTGLPNEARKKRRGMTVMSPAGIRAARDRHFPFLTGAGMRVAGLTQAIDRAG
ncbi:glycosyltransferase [Paracoccus sp. (in: a-proteobacteria)]|uniref:glycosyltransferase n=1 Tax=Paracoccus sp. TaxID=267 RepID=UPI0026DF83DA|nr:glycosyltransferase [Paracoccus sp. (in: a-proteobacteria)]